MPRRRRAEHGADARHELARRERLGHVVVGAELETDDAVALVAAGGQEDGGDRPARPDLAAQLKPVAARQHHVEHDQLGRFALDESRDLAAVARGDHAKPVACEVLPDNLTDGLLIVDHEHGAHHLH